VSKKWFAIHTYSGYENKVKVNLERRLKALGLEDKVSQLLIPTEEVAEIRGGKKRVSTKKFFPGYVLIETEMCDEIWYAVRNTPGVFGFIGEKNKPIPLDEEDINNLLRQIGEGEGKIRVKMKFMEGDSVRVIDGPFTNFMGVVGEVNPKREKLKVMLTILGRVTPVELDFLQVEKL
jgi:transcriptional antiterminator NusG